MKDNDAIQSIREGVLSVIKSGKINMRPKWYFVLKTVLCVIGGTMLLLSALYLVSFIFFFLVQSGVWDAPVYGFFGWYIFLRSLPWLLIGFFALFVFVLEILVRHFAFAYRRPLLYSACGILFVVLAGGYVVAATPLHMKLFLYAEKHPLPVAGPMYRQYGHHRLQNIYAGKIDELNAAGLILITRNGEELMVIVTSRTKVPPRVSLAPGDIVAIFGGPVPGREDAVEAFGIKKVFR